MFYSVFEKKHCVLPFFALTKNIIALKTSIFNVFRVRWGITVYQNCVADRSGFNQKSETLERAQEPGKAAPSAQRTMDPEIPLS